MLSRFCCFTQKPCLLWINAVWPKLRFHVCMNMLERNIRSDVDDAVLVVDGMLLVCRPSKYFCSCFCFLLVNEELPFCSYVNQYFSWILNIVTLPTLLTFKYSCFKLHSRNTLKKNQTVSRSDGNFQSLSKTLGIYFFLLSHAIIKSTAELLSKEIQYWKLRKSGCLMACLGKGSAKYVL